MRIALLSPYSWTYPGGVTRHIEALAERLLAGGHDVSVLAPFDPDDSLAARLHGGARPQARALPEYLKPLGRTAGLRMNGAMSNLALTPTCVMRLRHELRNGGYDVVHLHEPIAPIVSWDALGVCRTPMVGTFHCYSKSLIANHAATFMGARRRLNRLGVRIAVSEAAAWTNRRFFGGRYRVIPNGVDLPDTPLAPLPPADELRLVFVGQAVERKGLPVLLRAFEALREHIPVRLTIVGADADQVTPLLLDAQGVEIVGKVDDAHKQRLVHEADVLCAPSLGGESFGMVLTEAFAAGTPVVASDIAGYRDVVSHGENGLLVQRGDAAGLAEALRDLWEAPGRRAELAAGAEASAQRFAWQHVAEEVSEAYEDALAIPEPSGVVRRAATRVGALPADGQARVRARRLPSLEPAPAAGQRGAHALIRKAGLVIAVVVGVALT
ncbi:MAG TPA: glycosyltransferase family 4 protein, partial [Solirubrobacteraceae bacterium]|nr:glycosyltransferase family 4 protein [Solirubrobacteraceae bacterium]